MPGHSSIQSIGVKDLLDDIEIYRSKDLIEKEFRNLKDRFNLGCATVASEEDLEGKLFIQFIALIYLSKIKIPCERF